MPRAEATLTVAGEGWPAVVLVGGLGVSALDWTAVQQAVAAVTQTLRVQRGSVDGEAPPRDIDAIVDELHALLHRPGLRAGPCVLVGHSFGGLVVRRHAQRFRKDVAGLVLVDAMHEAQFETLAPLFPPPRDGESPALAAMREFFAGGWRDPSRNAECVDLPPSLERLAQAEAAIEVPLVVVSAGSYLNARLFGATAAERLQAAWGGLQNRLAALAPDVEQVVVEDSGHHLPRQAPQAVAEAVLRLVQRLRPGA